MLLHISHFVRFQGTSVSLIRSVIIKNTVFIAIIVPIKKVPLAIAPDSASALIPIEEALQYHGH